MIRLFQLSLCIFKNISKITRTYTFLDRPLPSVRRFSQTSVIAVSISSHRSSEHWPPLISYPSFVIVIEGGGIEALRGSRFFCVLLCTILSVHQSPVVMVHLTYPHTCIIHYHFWRNLCLMHVTHKCSRVRWTYRCVAY